MDSRIRDLIHEIEEDPENSSYTQRGIPPIFQADPKARILIIGQAPGRKVEETRIPFNDQSGEKLMQWLGMDRETFYSDAVAILPMDFYYPGKGKTGDLPPRKFVAGRYHPKVLALMPDIQLTVLIGAYSCKYYLGKRMGKNLTQTVQNYRMYLPQYFPIVHPSPLNFRWQKKNPWFEQETVPALKREVERALQPQ